MPLLVLAKNGKYLKQPKKIRHRAYLKLKRSRLCYFVARPSTHSYFHVGNCKRKPKRAK